MFDHCLYFNTTALARVLERQWAEAFKPFDLTPPQAFLLRAVLEYQRRDRRFGGLGLDPAPPRKRESVAAPPGAPVP